jgi:predicted acyltransferase
MNHPLPEPLPARCTVTAEIPHEPKQPAAGRILSIDQLRGYTIFGMILVNFLGEFESSPWLLRHNREWYSYADTIAPLFLFIVGMGFRLSYQRRMAKDGLWMARWSSAKRYFILTLIGIVVYDPFDWRGWWDALVDIGLSGLLALPFIEKGPGVRVGAAIGYLVLFQVLFTWSPYGPYLSEHSFDGGPLGPLSWVFSLLLGTLAYDWLATRDRRRIILNSLIWGLGLCALGWLFKFEWPGIKEHWPFSQRYMTMPYTLYSTGLAFLTFLFFFWTCDVVGLKFPHFSVLGLNPLVIYIFHMLLLGAHGDLVDRQAGFGYALGMFVMFYLVCYAVAWRFYRDKAVIKI